MGIENRRHIRIDAQNLSHIVVEENGATVYEGMGKTLNVSESGILLETHFKMEEKHVLEMTIAFEEEIVELKGRVVHCKAPVNEEKQRYETGINFIDMDDPAFRRLKRFVVLFKQQKEKETQKEQ